MIKKKEEVLKNRNSNIELLRIASMFLIVIGHSVVACGSGQTVTSLTPNLLYLQFVGSFGRSACSMFAVITGYFMSEKSSKKIYSNLIPLYLEMCFYALLGLVIAAIFVPNSIKLTHYIRVFVPFFEGGNWYFVAYILLLCFAPFINKLINSINKKEMDILLYTILIVFFVFNTLFRTYTSDLFFMVSMYIVGSYIKRYGYIYKRLSFKKYLLISLFSMFLMIISVFVIDIIILKLYNDFTFSTNNYFTDYYSILSICFVLPIFMLVKDLPSKQNKLINKISSTIGGIYLFHDNILIKEILWVIIFNNAKHYGSPYLSLIIECIAVFIVGIIIDLLRQKIYKHHLINKVNKLNNKFLDYFLNSNGKKINK